MAWKVISVWDQHWICSSYSAKVYWENGEIIFSYYFLKIFTLLPHLMLTVIMWLLYRIPMPEILLMSQMKQMDLEVDTVDKDRMAWWITARTVKPAHSLLPWPYAGDFTASACVMATLIGSIVGSNWVVHVKDLELCQIPDKIGTGLRFSHSGHFQSWPGVLRLVLISSCLDLKAAL